MLILKIRIQFNSFENKFDFKSWKIITLNWESIRNETKNAKSFNKQRNGQFALSGCHKWRL